MQPRKDDHLLATKKDIRAVHESIDQVLAVVINIDKKFSGKMYDHQRRIEKLESKIA